MLRTFTIHRGRRHNLCLLCHIPRTVFDANDVGMLGKGRNSGSVHVQPGSICRHIINHQRQWTGISNSPVMCQQRTPVHAAFVVERRQGQRRVCPTASRLFAIAQSSPCRLLSTARDHQRLFASSLPCCPNHLCSFITGKVHSFAI